MPPILTNKNHRAASVFTPNALLREARRQKQLDKIDVPPICVLDPDGDIVRRLRKSGKAKLFSGWPCYHTELYVFELRGLEVGIVGCAVGAPFAVLVAEELFASGCKFLISVTSAGQISPVASPPYFIIIDRALRDEGTSYHYAPPAEFAEADRDLIEQAAKAVQASGQHAIVGASWTTDAPFRETVEAIDSARSKNVLAVEMEAAALYTFARCAGVSVLCVAHVTNTMAQSGADFEKGEADGADAALAIIAAVAQG